MASLLACNTPRAPGFRGRRLGWLATRLVATFILATGTITHSFSIYALGQGTNASSPGADASSPPDSWFHGPIEDGCD